MNKARSPADAMNTAEKAAYPLAIGGRPQFRPAPAAPRENGVSEARMDEQRLAVAQKRRNHRNFLHRQFCRKCVFLTNRRVAPSTGTIEFGDDRLAVFRPDLIYTIFVAVEGQNPPVAAMSDRLERIQHYLGR